MSNGVKVENERISSHALLLDARDCRITVRLYIRMDKDIRIKTDRRTMRINLAGDQYSVRPTRLDPSL